jgi:hypothetical protein
MAMLLFVESMLWSIIGDVGFVVSSVVLATQALLSFHILTGKMETRPSSSSLDFLSLHALWAPFGRLMSCKIMSTISVACDFTTKSGGIC